MTKPRIRRSWGKRVMIYLLVIPVLVYLGICAIGYFAQGSIIYPRSFAGPSTVDAPTLRGAEVWWIDTEDGAKVEAWWMPAAPEVLTGPAPVVIFFHGNGELIEHGLDIARFYLSLGMHVAFLEYRGYGRSGGTPTEAGIVRDALALYDRIAARPDVDSSRIVFHGRSLGGGVGAALMTHHEPAALILESSFTSLVSMTSHYGLPAFLCRNPYRTDAALAEYHGPTLILHGEHDSIVPTWHARALADIAKHPTLVTRDADHNDLSGDFEWYSTTIADFLIRTGIITGRSPR